MEERKFVCHFCNKKFPSGKALGGHIRIHRKENSVASDRYNGSKKKRLVSQREMMTLKQQQQQQQVSCRECGKGFVSLKALSAHRDGHCEGEKMLIDSQSDTETSSAPTRKRSKRLMRQSNSESFSYGSSSSDSGIDQEVKRGASNLMKLSSDSSFKKRRNLVLVMNSLGESSDNNSVIVETKSSSGEELNVKNQVLETDKVADDDQLGSADDDGVILYDSNESDSDYFMNGPKKSDSDISVDGSFKNTGFGSGFNNSLNRFRNSDDGGGSKYELSKRRRVLPSYETDSCADTNSKIHRFRDSKSPIVRKAGGEKKKSKGHECPICFKMFKSGQALGGHKRSHSIAANQVVEMRNQIDLNLPASDSDE